MQKFFVTIGEITLAVYGVRYHAGFEVGYPTEELNK